MDKTMTLSFKTNPRQTNIRHNNRELTEKEFMSEAHKHIQREKSKYNIQIIKRDIKDVYHELFDDALNAYNTKQKRKDRKIDDYYKHVQKSKNLDLQREFIVTVGNKSDWERLSFEEKQEVGKALGRYVSDFNDRHSNMTIYNAIVHLDESGAPHAHFNLLVTSVKVCVFLVALYDDNLSLSIKNLNFYLKGVRRFGYPFILLEKVKY